MSKKPDAGAANESLAENLEFTANLVASFPKSANYRDAIRRKCLDCTVGSPGEVNARTIKSCALWAFRFGSNPIRETKASPFGG